MSEMTRDAENEMDAAVQCLYIAVDKSIADDVFSRWIAYKADRRQRIAQLEAEVKDVLECVYIPGVWACNQCEFQLIASNLYVQDGTIGPDTDTVPLCPNDGALMRRVTWKERVSGLDKYAGERLNEIDTLKAEVARLTEQITYLQTVSTEQVERIRALEPKDWTDEKPTVPGWYWYKRDEAWCQYDPCVVEIIEYPGGPAQYWTVRGADIYWSLGSFPGGQWSGPIEKPKGEPS